ncbi:Splicing factor 30 [Carabus blaptoides fortunei]
MADDLQNYKLQLQQVEAALLSDQDNKELLKLKVDLEEVIELTQDLKTKATESSKSPELFVGQSSDTCFDAEDEVTASLLAVERLYAKNKVKKIWKPTDKLMLHLKHIRTVA